MGEVRFESPVARECVPIDLEPLDVGPFLFNKTSLYSQCGKAGIFADDHAKLAVDKNGIRFWFSPGVGKTDDYFDIQINKYGQMFGELPRNDSTMLDILDCAAMLYPDDLKPAIAKARKTIEDALNGTARPVCDDSLDFWGIGMKIFIRYSGGMEEVEHRMEMSDDLKYENGNRRLLYLSSTGAIRRSNSRTYSKELFDQVLSSVGMLLDANPDSDYLKNLLTFLQMSKYDEGNIPSE